MAEDVQVEIVETDADEAQLETLGLRLRQELLLLDVRAVEPHQEGNVPEGSKGGLAAVAGLLSVSLAPGLQALGSVIVVIREWIRRSGSVRTVKLTVDGDVIELTGATGEMQQQLVDAFVRRHTGVDV